MSRSDPRMRIAREVRKRVWQWEKESPYPYDDSKDLEGYCGLASYTLAKMFLRYGFEGILVEGRFGGGSGYDHCWVESQGEIWDVTARQFKGNLPGVLVVPKSDPRYHSGKRRPLKAYVFKDWPTKVRPTRDSMSFLLWESRSTVKQS